MKSRNLTCVLSVVAVAVIAGILIFEPPLLTSVFQGSEEGHGASANTQGAKDAKPNRVFKFGFDLRASPEEDARQYLPFLKYLERSTGYAFKLRFTKKGADLARDLGEGTVHFAAVGAVSFLKGKRLYGVLPVVRGLNKQDKAAYQSVIVVAPDSEIKSIEDLRGKRFALGSKSSTQGHLIPRIVLGGAGIALQDFASFEYTGSHQNCANAVITGKFDACGMQDTMGRDLEKRGKLRILDTSPYFPSSGIAANKDLAPDVISAVQKALIDFRPKGRDREGLYNWQQTEMPNGFSVAKSKDYEVLEVGIKKLGMAN